MVLKEWFKGFGLKICFGEIDVCYCLIMVS